MTWTCRLSSKSNAGNETDLMTVPVDRYATQDSRQAVNYFSTCVQFYLLWLAQGEWW